MRIFTVTPTHQRAEQSAPSESVRTPLLQAQSITSDSVAAAGSENARRGEFNAHADVLAVDALCDPSFAEIAHSVAKQVAIRRGIAQAIEEREPGSAAAVHHRTVAAAMSEYTTSTAIKKFALPPDLFSNPDEEPHTFARLNAFVEDHAIAFARTHQSILARLPDEAAIGRAFAFTNESKLMRFMQSLDRQAVAGSIPPLTFVFLPKLLIGEQLLVNAIKADRLVGTECLIHQ